MDAEEDLESGGGAASGGQVSELDGDNSGKRQCSECGNSTKNHEGPYGSKCQMKKDTNSEKETNENLKRELNEMKKKICCDGKEYK